MSDVEFQSFPKLSRLFRKMVISEKIDGSNAQIYITDDGDIYAGSRNRWVTPTEDNMGFATWVENHKDELVTGLGPGRHYGEWFGSKIQRGYGLTERRFALFNVQRWYDPRTVPNPDALVAEFTKVSVCPECCTVVPTLCVADVFDTSVVNQFLQELRQHGSYMVPGYMNPEGLIVYHDASQVMMKVLLDQDELPKSLHR